MKYIVVPAFSMRSNAACSFHAAYCGGSHGVALFVIYVHWIVHACHCKKKLGSLSSWGRRSICLYTHGCAFPAINNWNDHGNLFGCIFDPNIGVGTGLEYNPLDKYPSLVWYSAAILAGSDENPCKF